MQRSASDTAALQTTADVFDAIQPVVPDDRVFESRFATTSVYRIRTGAYLLLALRRDAAGELDAADVPPALLRHQYTAEAVLPRGGDPEDWPGWTEDDVVALSRRLGNFVLVETRERFSGRPWPDRKAALNVGGLHTNEIPANAEHWLPEHVQGRQAEFASRAPFVWPPDLPLGRSVTVTNGFGGLSSSPAELLRADETAVLGDWRDRCADDDALRPGEAIPAPEQVVAALGTALDRPQPVDAGPDTSVERAATLFLESEPHHVRTSIRSYP